VLILSNKFEGFLIVGSKNPVLILCGAYNGGRPYFTTDFGLFLCFSTRLHFFEKFLAAQKVTLYSKMFNFWLHEKVSFAFCQHVALLFTLSFHQKHFVINQKIVFGISCLPSIWTHRKCTAKNPLVYKSRLEFVFHRAGPKQLSYPLPRRSGGSIPPGAKQSIMVLVGRINPTAQLDRLLANFDAKFKFFTHSCLKHVLSTYRITQPTSTQAVIKRPLAKNDCHLCMFDGRSECKLRHLPGRFWVRIFRLLSYIKSILNVCL
jgi:hypothetical protein